MKFSEYSIEAEKTAIYPGQGTDNGVVYCALGVAGEAGEVANKVKKLLRDGVQPDSEEKLISEMGDCLWYLDRLATEVGTSLADIAELNLDKLRRRFDSGTLRGAGDER